MPLTEAQVGAAMDAAVARLVPQLSPAAKNVNTDAVERQRATVEALLRDQVIADYIDVGTAGTDILAILVNPEGPCEMHERELPAWLATLPELQGARILVAAETI